MNNFWFLNLPETQKDFEKKVIGSSNWIINDLQMNNREVVLSLMKFSKLAISEIKYVEERIEVYNFLHNDNYELLKSTPKKKFKVFKDTGENKDQSKNIKTKKVNSNENDNTTNQMKILSNNEINKIRSPIKSFKNLSTEKSLLNNNKLDDEDDPVTELKHKSRLSAYKRLSAFKKLSSTSNSFYSSNSYSRISTKNSISKIPTFKNSNLFKRNEKSKLIGPPQRRKVVQNNLNNELICGKHDWVKSNNLKKILINQQTNFNDKQIERLFGKIDLHSLNLNEIFKNV